MLQGFSPVLGSPIKSEIHWSVSFGIFFRLSSSTNLLEIVLTLVKKVWEFLHWTFNENEKFCVSPEVPIQPCRPKSDSAPPGVIWAQFKPNSPIKRLFQPTLGPISALGSKSAPGNWTVFALIKGTELDSKIGLFQLLTHGPPSLGLKQIFLISLYEE